MNWIKNFVLSLMRMLIFPVLIFYVAGAFISSSWDFKIWEPTLKFLIIAFAGILLVKYLLQLFKGES